MAYFLKTSSCKAKGRRCVQEAKDLILRFYPWLHPDDLIITGSGDTGEDLKMSPAARDVLPYKIECKNTEGINIWKAYQQAESHKGEYVPVVVFKRNKSKLLVCLSFEDFLFYTRPIDDSPLSKHS